MEAEEIKSNETPETNATTESPAPTKQPVPIPEVLTQQQALQVLVDAAKISQSKGVFSLDDAELVNKAIKAFVVPQGPTPSNG